MWLLSGWAVTKTKTTTAATATPAKSDGNGRQSTLFCMLWTKIFIWWNQSSSNKYFVYNLQFNRVIECVHLLCALFIYRLSKFEKDILYLSICVFGRCTLYLCGTRRCIDGTFKLHLSRLHVKRKQKILFICTQRFLSHIFALAINRVVVIIHPYVLRSPDIFLYNKKTKPALKCVICCYYLFACLLMWMHRKPVKKVTNKPSEILTQWLITTVE